MSDETTRTLAVDYLARVEGEGALRLVWSGDELTDVELNIFEPPRFFEGFLQGRSCLETPDITARICGICPVAYQMSASAAVEDALGIALPDPYLQLRRVLYCGEWIESHVLHMLMLHTPDFLGVDDAMAVAREHGDMVRAGLKVKKAGNDIVNVVGGREIHPINVRIGGFYRLPRRSEIDALVAQLKEARPLAEAMLRWMGTFHFPELEVDVELVALKPEGLYPFIEGPIASTGGLCVPVQEWANHFAEEHVARTHALHARLHGEPYLTGPLARFALNFDALPADLRALSAELGIGPGERNPFKSLLVRGIEVLFALDEAVRILEQWRAPKEAAVPVELKKGSGWGVSEAPRGTLVHHYEVDDEGLIKTAIIVPPTSQNQLAIESDLRNLGTQLKVLDDAAATHRAEMAIRNYDPCISCATHFLRFERVFS
ncbi:MAG: Ni/Fe hydrogenase subunit alpha [Deltaproteobacteria bacterium]|nr:MAG: Ni/Fe hydrogenase subunit alpha [Deltaproteobacteria bacterium]